MENLWCLILCCVCMVPLLATAEGPKDVLFDALGLTFLYNMDDISGDFGFIDEKWDEEVFGHIYGRLADEVGIMVSFQESRKKHFTADNVYTLGRHIGRVLLVVLPLAVL